MEYSVLPVTDPLHQYELGNDFQVIATVTNTTKDTITGVAPLSAPTLGISGIVTALSQATPVAPQSIPAKGQTMFSWSFRATKGGKAFHSGECIGVSADSPFTMTATAYISTVLPSPVSEILSIHSLLWVLVIKT